MIDLSQCRHITCINDATNYANTGASGVVTARRVEYSCDFADRVSEAFVITKTSNGSGGEITGARAAHRKLIYSANLGSVEEWTYAKTNVFDSFAYNSDLPP